MKMFKIEKIRFPVSYSISSKKNIKCRNFVDKTEEKIKRNFKRIRNSEKSLESQKNRALQSKIDFKICLKMLWT